MKKTFIHKIKLIIAHIKWFFYITSIIAKHKKNITKFSEFFDKRKQLQDELLSLDRKSDLPSDEKTILMLQLEIMNEVIEIITYK